MAINQEEYKDLGFGNAPGKRTQRLINSNGSFNVRRKGTRLRDLHLYHFLIGLSWPKFWLSVLVFYLFFNTLFASLYMLAGIEQLTGYPHEDATVQNFAYAFYFSVQTFTTVGYGAISPSGHPANLIASIEAMTGLIAFAFAASILYGRFARPTARILYSEKALIAPYREGLNAWMCRIANGRMNQLIELEAKIIFTWFPEGEGGKRRYDMLQLERDNISLFPLSWTLVHPITEESPLFQMTPEQLSHCNPEFLIMIKAYDDTFAQDVHSRSSYKAEDCVWGARFSPMFFTDDEGGMVLDLGKLGEFAEARLNG